MKPLGMNLLILPARTEETTKSGIIIPGGDKAGQLRGKVEEKPDNKKFTEWNTPNQVHVRDMVMYEKGSEKEVVLKNESGEDVKYHLVPAYSLIAVLA